MMAVAVISKGRWLGDPTQLLCPGITAENVGRMTLSVGISPKSGAFNRKRSRKASC